MTSMADPLKKTSTWTLARRHLWISPSAAFDFHLVVPMVVVELVVVELVAPRVAGAVTAVVADHL